MHVNNVKVIAKLLSLHFGSQILVYILRSKATRGQGYAETPIYSHACKQCQGHC